MNGRWTETAAGESVETDRRFDSRLTEMVGRSGRQTGGQTMMEMDRRKKNEEEIDETSNQIGNGLEKNGKNDPNKIQSISKYLVAGAISTIISR